MADPGALESGKPGKKKAKTEDGPSFSSPRRGEMICDGEAAEGDSAVEEGSMDPLVVFGSGIMMMILSKLDARSVALARLVSRGWLLLASSDKIWAPKCEELWQGKAHIPRISKVQGLPKMVAYSLSIMDGKRIRITRDDLCDHAWEFHFTQAAPEYWRELDPYWQGGGAPAMRRYFHPDGSITADPDDKVWGGHESSYTIVTGLLSDGKIREHYVRINRWPKLTVLRIPDWSWVLHNHLYCYTSIPDAHTHHQGTGPSFPLF